MALVGTDKRERQKANRQLKLEEMARDARKRKTKKRALQIGIGVPLLIGLMFGLVWLFGDHSSSSKGAATVPDACPAADGSAPVTNTFTAAPPMCIDLSKTYSIVVDTSLGSYTAVLDASKAPMAVNNMVVLARFHYFDNTPCHRIIPDFVVQCGDPTGSGTGGPGYQFDDELPAAGEYQLGSLAMANSGPNTNGSQFFVISGQQGIDLDPNYTLFGQVTDGLDTTIPALNAVGSPDGTPSEQVTINSVTVLEN